MTRSVLWLVILLSGCGRDLTAPARIVGGKCSYYVNVGPSAYLQADGDADAEPCLSLLKYGFLITPHGDTLHLGPKS